MQKWLMFLTSKGLAEDGSRVMNESDIMRTMLETSVPYYVTVPDDANQPIDHGYNGIALGWYSETYRGNLINTLALYNAANFQLNLFS